MKKLIPLSLAVAVLLTIFAGSSPRTVNAQGAGVVSSILNRMERNRRDMRSLRAAINMEKWNNQLREAERSEGWLAYMPATGRNAYVRVEWQKPRREILTVADGQYQLYNQRQNVVYEGRASGGKNTKASSVLSYLNMSAAQIRANFNADYIGDETLWGGVNTSHLKITPKGSASYKYAEIWVDGAGMLIQAKVVERNDDSTTVRLLNLQKNDNIPVDHFRQQLPDGVKRVKS
ncbi:MAG: outer membrane lipoprotein carrier protein LolA [Pyrinomonadaceae bacterium]|nr:outer membrane lipoprotein carrier protein LolA [Pyrinomonadaceae bacterium]